MLRVIVLAVWLLSTGLVSPPAVAAIAWQDWSAATFASAREQNKPVFLYLEAVWCHWCHVMQRQTLARPEVQAQLAQHFVAVRVDHDADPGLANRYRDYGWPALIFLSPGGVDLVKRAGYIAPENFSRLLQAIARDPTPEAQAQVSSPPAGPSQLQAGAREYLLRRHDESFDPELGGLRTAQKFIDRDSVEYALENADGNAGERRKALLTLDAARALIDPVWGGAYQYSTGRGWNHPHFEKIMRVQAGYLRIYALAYARFGRPADLRTAGDLQRYLFDFLRSPDGAFYVSQDADVVPGEKSAGYYALDDAARRARGMPRVDRNRYADANGLAAEALAVTYAHSGDPQALQAAVGALQWTLRERRGEGALMRHGDAADASPHLSDSLFVARAALSLYEVTADRTWLAEAESLAQAIDRSLRAPEAGYLTEGPVAGLPVVPRPDLAENIAAARFYNRLAHYSGQGTHRRSALHAMRFLAGHAARQEDFEEAGILLADDELARDPIHLAVVGAKSDPAAQDLFAAAVGTAGSYRRIEWWDRSEGPLPHDDVPYPKLSRAAGYVCSDGRCSRPSYEAPDYRRQIGRLAGSLTPNAERGATNAATGTYDPAPGFASTVW